MGLPSGTVTFLFSDIEGSTQLARQLGTRYADVLAQHALLLRSVFSELGGHEIDTQGDAFFVAFATAKDAVLAAVGAQRALADHDWPDGNELRVRIGLHTGEAAVDEDRYLGVAVHRAARICAAGHGGQVLLSQSTKAVLEDEQLAGIELRELGHHQLKDFERPEPIYQLVIPGLQTEFPALRAPYHLGRLIDHVHLRVRDLEASKRFYSAVLAGRSAARAQATSGPTSSSRATTASPQRASTSPSKREIATWCTPSTTQPSRPAAATTAARASVAITPGTTPPTCSTRTATTSKLFITARPLARPTRWS